MQTIIHMNNDYWVIFNSQDDTYLKFFFKEFTLNETMRESCTFESGNILVLSFKRKKYVSQFFIFLPWEIRN